MPNLGQNLFWCLWPWPFVWTSLLSMVITPTNSCWYNDRNIVQKGITERWTVSQMDGQNSCQNCLVTAKNGILSLMNYLKPFWLPSFQLWWYSLALAVINFNYHLSSLTTVLATLITLHYSDGITPSRHLRCLIRKFCISAHMPLQYMGNVLITRLMGLI